MGILVCVCMGVLLFFFYKKKIYSKDTETKGYRESNSLSLYEGK